MQLSYTLDQKQLDRFDDILQKDLIDNGVRCVFLIDMAGNIITNLVNVARTWFKISGEKVVK